MLYYVQLWFTMLYYIKLNYTIVFQIINNDTIWKNIQDMILYHVTKFLNTLNYITTYHITLDYIILNIIYHI